MGCCFRSYFKSRFRTLLSLEDALKAGTSLLGVVLLEHLTERGEVSLQQPCLKVALFFVRSLLVSTGLGCKGTMPMGFQLLALLLFTVCTRGVGDSWVQY